MKARRLVLAAILTLGFIAAPLVAEAQQASGLRRIGYLGISSPSLEPHYVEAFRQQLRDLGYIEGQHIAIEYRWAEGRDDRLPDLAAELVRLDPVVIVTTGTPGTLAAKQATKTIPIVMASSADPVRSGLVASLARPGGNVTGFTILGPELEGKRMELLKRAVPRLSRVAVLWNPANAYQTGSEKEVQAAARVLRISIVSLPVRNPEELGNALATIPREHADAVLVLADRLFLHNRERIADFAIKNRLPGMNAYRELVEAGGLMSFVPSYAMMHRQAATYVDKSLKGAKAGDMPIEQPAKFELVMNLKTAKALGLTIPQSLLLRADEVIQ